MTEYTVEQAHRLQDLAEALRDRRLTLKDIKEIAAEDFPELGLQTSSMTREKAFCVLMDNAEATYQGFEKGEKQ